MKYQVIYTKNNKNKNLKKQVATFYKIEDASLWEKYVIEQGHSNVEIIPIF